MRTVSFRECILYNFHRSLCVKQRTQWFFYSDFSKVHEGCWRTLPKSWFFFQSCLCYPQKMIKNHESFLTNKTPPCTLFHWLVFQSNFHEGPIIIHMNIEYLVSVQCNLSLFSSPKPPPLIRSLLKCHHAPQYQALMKAPCPWHFSPPLCHPLQYSTLQHWRSRVGNYDSLSQWTLKKKVWTVYFPY